MFPFLHIFLHLLFYQLVEARFHMMSQHAFHVEQEVHVLVSILPGCFLIVVIDHDR